MQPNNQVHIAIMLLWTSVALGVMNIALHGWLIHQATGQWNTSSPLLISAAVLVFVQGRIILRLHSGNAAVRTRLLFITLVRMAVLAPSIQVMFTLMPALVLLPGIAVLLQLIALGLVFLPPGSAYFAQPVPVRRRA